MSPLVSLLALGALLAAADAKVTQLQLGVGGKCSGIIIDITSRTFFGDVYEQKFDFKGNGNEQVHNITNHCSALGMAISSQTVLVCDNSPDILAPGEPLVRDPPLTKDLGDERLSPVYSACYPELFANGKCGVLDFHITQKCRYIYTLDK